MILIATNQRDVTSDLVILQLQHRGLPYVRFNAEDFLSRGGFSWAIDNDGAVGRLEHRGKTLDLDTVSSIWYRRPGTPQLPERLEGDIAHAFVRQESEATLLNMWALLDRLWVSHPLAIQRSSRKLLQLRRATAAGFVIPATLLTTDPEQARAFCLLHHEVVAKPLGRGIVEGSNGGKILFYANRLGSEDLARLDDVAWGPTLFQELIRKRHDLRVTVVGRSVFATEIHAPASTEAGIDWRRVPVERVPHAPHTLPSDTEKRILDLVRGFDLQFAALDFVVDQDGQYVFLELNPNGQWAWIEQLLGTPISAALVDLLSSAATPL